jgi:transposase InsO family protein
VQEGRWVSGGNHNRLGYASAAYVERLIGIGTQISMSAKGNPYDNAKAESFFKTLKRDEFFQRRSPVLRGDDARTDDEWRIPHSDHTI